MLRCTRHHRRSQRITRRGTAPLEFLMMLPMILSIVVFALWVYRVRNAALLAGLQAELATLEQAARIDNLHDLGSAEELSIGSSMAFNQLVQAFHPNLSVGSGWITSVATMPTGAGAPGIGGPAGETSDSHAMLSHAFTGEVLQFPTNSSDQPPLTLPPCAGGVVPGLSGLGSFTQLLGL